MRRTSFMRFNLKRSNKRFLALLTLLPISVLVLALIYMEGMDRLDGGHGPAGAITPDLFAKHPVGC